MEFKLSVVDETMSEKIPLKTDVPRLGVPGIIINKYQCFSLVFVTMGVS